MKLDSKYFDSVRVRRKDEPEQSATGPCCNWKGCKAAASHRAPKGRGREGEYYQFCLDHVRQYNASYNYFNGMSDMEVEDFQKGAVTGHRPTWKLGANAWSTGREDTAKSSARGYARYARYGAYEDPQEILEGADEPATPQQRRALRTLERKALDTLHLPETATKAEIKARFKELVKRHHPDANGGDRGAEDKLREIIQAYNYLKQAGLV